MDLVDELASGSMSLSSAGGTEPWDQDLTEIFAQPSLASNQPQASIDMNSHKKKKKRALHQKSTKDYSESYLQSMLNNVKNGRMTMYHVDKYYGIPRGTLQYRLGTKFMNKGRKGPDTVLTTEEEAVVLSWILTMERRGFPVTRRGLVAKVSAYLKQHPRTNPCRNSVPDTPPSDLSNCSSFYKHQETESVSASKFFVAPPSPKRCSKHRFINKNHMQF
nr:uncharacterized protein LOC109422895 [Aedes albopictus]